MIKLASRHGLLAGSACLALLAAAPARAGVVDWTTWSGATDGSSGTATGTAGSLTVTYSGEVESLVADYPSWTPSTSYVGGSVGNAPPQSGGIIQLFGGPDGAGTDTITFSTAVTDPVIAIWSLGAGGDPAEFVFNETPTFEAGGPSLEYGGGAIVVSGDTVSGQEGNGTVQFMGTFSSISWTTPEFEDWYGFTVGAPASSSVPEPASWALLLVGFAGLGGALRARRMSPARA